MERWFVAIQGKKFGPLTVSKLRILVSQSILKPDCHVWRMGLSEWMPARHLPELFPQNEQSPSDTSLKTPVSTANPREWYYNNAGDKAGPLTLEELHQLIAQGVITKETFLWRHGSSSGWLQAEEHSGIFPNLKPRTQPRTSPLSKVLSKLKVLSHIW